MSFSSYTPIPDRLTTWLPPFALPFALPTLMVILWRCDFLKSNFEKTGNFSSPSRSCNTPLRSRVRTQGFQHSGWICTAYGRVTPNLFDHVQSRMESWGKQGQVKFIPLSMCTSTEAGLKAMELLEMYLGDQQDLY
ncbi:hypothetical protein BYT27DRAFT_7210454 [Phlegmacium glaucopus]|nr:hypothetical protein BYT27DRAFT_7210454 [Phlegmacium glaucopus]